VRYRAGLDGDAQSTLATSRPPRCDDPSRPLNTDHCAGGRTAAQAPVCIWGARCAGSCECCRTQANTLVWRCPGVSNQHACCWLQGQQRTLWSSSCMLVDVLECAPQQEIPGLIGRGLLSMRTFVTASTLVLQLLCTLTAPTPLQARPPVPFHRPHRCTATRVATLGTPAALGARMYACITLDAPACPPSGCCGHSTAPTPAAGP
jgi:hypothetical protein